MNTPNPTAIDPRTVEAVARAIKDEMGQQFGAVPLVDSQPGDWTATGGTFDLTAIARAAIIAYTKAVSMPVVGTAGEG